MAAAVRARSTVLGVGALTALAAALRFPTLDVQSLWLDESYTVVIALHTSLAGALENV